VENRKSREKKRICSEVSVNSPGNPWSQPAVARDSIDAVSGYRYCSILLDKAAAAILQGRVTGVSGCTQ